MTTVYVRINTYNPFKNAGGELSLLKHNKVTPDRDRFGDPVVYRTSDEFGDILVIDRDSHRSLTFDSIFDQSSVDLKKPNSLVHEYTHAMMLVTAFVKPRHATILGLGGGCLLRSLHYTWPQCELHAVELRQRVYEVASEYFGIPVSERITVSIADAEQHLINTDDSSTNIIFADMYTAFCMNPFQVQQDFINQCYRVLNKKGWLVINYHEIPDLNISFFKFICSLFSDVYVYKTVIGNNNILFASKDRVDALVQYKSIVAGLEKTLGNKPLNFFNRLTRLNSVGRYRQAK